ncbi:MAG: SDR family oxidoreductase [Corynebacterium sp.]|nr:SDR family oxidoreductase [Corynebacterium sp.]
MIENRSTSLGKLARRDAILVLGATSDIGGELAAHLCWQRHVILAARRPEATAKLAERLTQAGATKVDILPFEATDMGKHREIIEKAYEMAGGALDYAIVAFGILGDQSKAEHDERHAREIATIDYTAQISVLTVLSDILQKQETRSTIIAFSSIAGTRARRPNYVYGSTKAGLDAFCQGLSDALYGSQVRLITVRPGFVIGHMTEGMKPAPMSVTPRDVASAVVSHMAADVESGKFRSSTLWVPGKLKFVAALMRWTPRRLWRKAPR